MSIKSVLTLVVVVSGALLQGCASGSRFQGLDAAAVFQLAQEDFEKEEYGDAAEALDRLLLAFPTFNQAPAALMLLGTAHFRDEQYITAAGDYARFLDRYPGHPDAAEAAMGICRSYSALSPISQRDQTYTEQALAVCANVVADYPAAPVAPEAAERADEMREKLARKVYENARYYMRRQFHDSAIIYFEELVETYPNTTWAPKALAGIIEAYGIIGYEDEVEAARTQLLTRYPESPEARAISGDEPRGSDR